MRIFGDFAWKAALFSIVLLGASDAWADVDLTVNASNVTQGEKDAISELFRGSYSEVAEDTVNIVQEGEASQRIHLSIVRVGERLQVRAARYQGGKIVHSAKAMLASLEEAPEVMERLATASFKRTDYGGTAKVDNLTEEEIDTPLKKNTDSVNGVRMAIMLPYHGNQDFNPYFSFGYDGRFEADFFFVELGGGFATPFPYDRATPKDERPWLVGGMYLDLGFSVYMTKTAVAPYLGLGLQPRFWISNKHVGPNLVPYAQLGVMALRNYKMRVYFEGRAGYNIAHVGRQESASAELSSDLTEAPIRPWEFGGAVGIGF